MFCVVYLLCALLIKVYVNARILEGLVKLSNIVIACNSITIRRDSNVWIQMLCFKCLELTLYQSRKLYALSRQKNIR